MDPSSSAHTRTHFDHSPQEDCVPSSYTAAAGSYFSFSFLRSEGSFRHRWLRCPPFRDMSGGSR